MNRGNDFQVEFCGETEFGFQCATASASSGRQWASAFAVGMGTCVLNKRRPFWGGVLSDVRHCLSQGGQAVACTYAALLVPRRTSSGMDLRRSLRESLAAETETMRVSDRIPRSMSSDIRRGRLNTDPPCACGYGSNKRTPSSAANHALPWRPLKANYSIRPARGQHAVTTVPRNHGTGRDSDGNETAPYFRWPACEPSGLWLVNFRRDSALGESASP